MKYGRYRYSRKLSYVIQGFHNREIHPDDLPGLESQIKILTWALERALKDNADNSSGRMV
jgi:hypothetical protein